MASVLLLGIGQRLRGDDALGLATIEAWQKKHPNHPAVAVATLESPGLSLLTALSGYATAIIVDAVRTGAEAGRVFHLQDTEITAFGPGASSAHGFGVAETLAMGRTLQPEELPTTVYLIGIEAGSVEVGMPISQEGRRAIPKAVQAIEDALEKLDP
ncbi:MAG: hydrogenase maturation protease [Anaerolineales bacterium]